MTEPAAPTAWPATARCVRQGLARALVALAAACLAACAPTALLTYDAQQPPTVTLPVAQAGVRDERAAFAALFEREWRAANPTAPDADLAQWLHGPRPGADGRRPDLARLDAAFAARAPSTAVLVVPGMFGDCVAAQSVPFGDGVRRSLPLDPAAPYRQYADLGLRELRLLPLPGRASTAVNGAILAAAIARLAQRADLQRLVLVGYSKGTPDILEALARLQREGGVPAQLKAVVSVAGAVMGTPLADPVATAFDALSAHVTPLDCTPSQGDEMLSLTRRQRVAWLAAHALPAGVAYHSVVAHAPLQEMALPLRLTAGRLAAIDPRNDGQLLASDALLPGGTLLAEARADHWDVALPRDRHPDAFVRALTSGRAYPREALFRALLRWVVADP